LLIEREASAPLAARAAFLVGLQGHRPVGIGQPELRDLAQCSDDFRDVLGSVGLGTAFLARLHIGRQRLAAFLDHARKVPGEDFDIEAPFLGRWDFHIVLHARVVAIAPHRPPS